MTREETTARRAGARPPGRPRVEGTQGLSGHIYVVGELDVSRPGAGEADGPLIRRSAIRILTSRNCDHCETVCSECAEQWMYDWTFRFDRTAGGRRLLGEIGGERALAEMARRRAAAEARPAVPARTVAGSHVIEVDDAVLDALTRMKRDGETCSDAIRRALGMPPAGGANPVPAGGTRLVIATAGWTPARSAPGGTRAHGHGTRPLQWQPGTGSRAVPPAHGPREDTGDDDA